MICPAIDAQGPTRRHSAALGAPALDVVDLVIPSGGRSGESTFLHLSAALENLVAPKELTRGVPRGERRARPLRLVLDALRALADEGRMVVMVTHDAGAAARADQVVRFADGRVVSHAERPA